MMQINAKINQVISNKIYKNIIISSSVKSASKVFLKIDVELVAKEKFISGN